MFSPGYHRNLDVNQFPVSAVVNTGIDLPFVLLCFFLAIGGIYAIGDISEWPASAYRQYYIFISIPVPFFCLLGYARINLEITRQYVDWTASRIPMIVSHWREPISAFTHIAIRKVAPSVSVFALYPYELTRMTLSDRGRRSSNGKVKLVEVLLYHGTRPKERSVSLGCFLDQGEEWHTFAMQAAKTFNLKLLNLPR